MRHTVVSLLLDGGATIEEVADLTGDDPVTLYRHYRHRVRPVSTIGAEGMPKVLDANSCEALAPKMAPRTEIAGTESQ
jgi:hypothetical protein